MTTKTWYRSAALIVTLSNTIERNENIRASMPYVVKEESVG